MNSFTIKIKDQLPRGHLEDIAQKVLEFMDETFSLKDFSCEVIFHHRLDCQRCGVTNTVKLTKSANYWKCANCKSKNEV